MRTEARVDGIDRKILALYQRDVRQPAARIGAAVGLSAAAVQRRLKRLRESGVIAAEVARLDAARLGFAVTCVVGVTAGAATAPRSQLARFKRELAAQPEVQQCYHVTGSLDFVLVVVVASLERYADFVARVLEPNRSVARFDTYVVLDTVKSGSAVPL